MNYIEYKNKLYLILTVDASTTIINAIKKNISKIWNNKYKTLIVNVLNTDIPSPYDYTSLVKYAKKKNIKIIFE